MFTLVIGPMFSGKSSYILDKLERRRIAKDACILVSYIDDNRYTPHHGGQVTHSNHEWYHVPILKTSKLTLIIDQLLQHEVIGIDEVQFYNDAPEVIHYLAGVGKTVYAAGLDADRFGRPFGRVGELVNLADNVIKLQAVCSQCGNNASFTRGTSTGSELIEIGGTDKYEAVCRSCMWPEPPHRPVAAIDTAED